MSDQRSKIATLVERARPGFAPTADARQRMRDAVLARVAAAASDASASAAEAQPAPESGLRLALRNSSGKVLLGVLCVLTASTFATSYAARGSDPGLPRPAAATHERSPVPSADCSGRACSGAPAEAATEPDVAPSVTTVSSPHALADAPRPAESARGPVPGRVRVVLPPKARPIEHGQSAGANETTVDTPRRSEDLLGKEVRLIREAQVALRAGDVERARTVLDAHAHEFQDGVLREERLVLNVLLLCAEHETERAQRAADALVRANPTSRHLESLRASCAGMAVP